MTQSKPTNDEQGTKKRILVVDDEETLRLSIEQVLSEDSHHVITAKNGTEALKLARAEGFDLVITDLRMPGLTGFQLVSEIKKTDPLTKFIVISAFGTMDTVMEAMRLGVSDFVAKPFKVKSMKENVDRILSAPKKSTRTEDLYKLTSNAEEVEKKTGGILIQPNLPYYLDQSQELSARSSAFFDAVDIAGKKLALIFGRTSYNYDEAGAYFYTTLLSTMIKTVFRTVVTSSATPAGSTGHNQPKHVVEKINKCLCLNTRPRIPVSLFCAMIDEDEGVIEYVNQGQKLFCCLIQDDSNVMTLESSPYPLNQFPEIHMEGKRASLTSDSKLILSSSESLSTLPFDEEAVKADLKGVFSEPCLPRESEGTAQGGDEKPSLWYGKEAVRRIRANLFDTMSTNKLDNDWAVMGMSLNWKGTKPKQEKQEKITIPAATSDFQGIVKQIEDTLRNFTLTPQKEHSIVTAINEAIINAKLYAYNNDSNRTGNGEKGDIIVTFKVIGNELIVEVFDDGCGFSVQPYKRQDFSDYPSVTAEGGRGIFLIHELMDRVMIQSSGNIGTRVYMAKEVKSNGG